MRSLDPQLGLLVLFFLLYSCNSTGVKVGAKAAQQLTKNFAKNAGKNSKSLIGILNSAKVMTLKNGRKIPTQHLLKLRKTPIPDPKGFLGSQASNQILNGSDEAVKAVRSAPIDLVLYDTKGFAIHYADPLHQKVVQGAAAKTYQQQSVNLVDKTFQAIQQSKTKVTSEAQIKQLIQSTVERELGRILQRPHVFNPGSGYVTLNLQFNNGSFMIGSFNIFKTVLSGLGITTGGVYMLKKEAETQRKMETIESILKAYKKSATVDVKQ